MGESKRTAAAAEAEDQWWADVDANAVGALAAYLDRVGTADVDVDQRNRHGETALMIAAARGWDRMVAVLLAHGADMSISDRESGWTALHRALYYEHLSTSLVLLQHARRQRGPAFMKESLYEIKDRDGLSAMDLLTTIQRDVAEMEEEYQSGASRGGMIYTFGKVDFQLGYHLPHMNVQSFPRKVEFPRPSPIVQVSASRFHTIALNKDGQVFVWGFGKGGRLGTGTQHNCIEPTLLDAFHEIPIAKVAAGENHSMALSCSGQVFSWGSNSFGQLGHNIKTCTQDMRLLPKRIDAFRGESIIDIAASGCHSAAICSDHFVYTWGSNKKGQLGRKEGFGSDQPSSTPRRVDRLVSGHALSVIHEPHDSLQAVQVAMSDVQTCVIIRLVKQGHSHGQVWQFGNGSNVPSRVVFKDECRTRGFVLSDVWVPRWKMQSDDIVAVSCALNHSIALTACGAVFTWGHNGDALSHQQDPDRELQIPGTPQRVQLDRFGPIASICASTNHCAVVTRDGNLVTWGCGPQGVLGHGAESSWEPHPKHVRGAKKVCAVAMGHQHTALLVSPRVPVPMAAPMESGSPPKLRTLLERFISTHVDLSNVVTIWKYAEVLSQLDLEQYCHEYMARNWDALLEMGGKERLDVLFHMVLPSEVTPNDEGGIDRCLPIAAQLTQGNSRGKASTTRKSSISFQDADVKPPEPPVSEGNPAAAANLTSEQEQSHVRRKAVKFVPLELFLHGQREPKAPTTEIKPPPSPWKSPSQAPLGAASPCTPSPQPRKNSFETIQPPATQKPSARFMSSSSLKTILPSSPQVASHQPHSVTNVSSTPPASTFSLDAFIVKKDKRKKQRGASSNDPSQTTAHSWGTTPAEKPSTFKSLRDIQAEEEATAAAEATARAQFGGWVQKASSINRWGLVEQPEHVSLAELQQREEEERFLQEQQRILEQIQATNRQQQRQGTHADAPPTQRSKDTRRKSKAHKKPQRQDETTEDAHAASASISMSSGAAREKKKKRPSRSQPPKRQVNATPDSTPLLDFSAKEDAAAVIPSSSSTQAHPRTSAAHIAEPAAMPSAPRHGPRKCSKNRNPRTTSTHVSS